MIDKQTLSILGRVIFNDGFIAGMNNAIRINELAEVDKDSLATLQNAWDESKAKATLTDMLNGGDEHDNMGKQTRQTQLNKAQELSVRPRGDTLL